MRKNFGVYLSIDLFSGEESEVGINFKLSNLIRLEAFC